METPPWALKSASLPFSMLFSAKASRKAISSMTGGMTDEGTDSELQAPNKMIVNAVINMMSFLILPIDDSPVQR